MPYLGRSSNFGVRSVFHYLPSAGDTSVSGADEEITITHVADTGLNLKHTGTGDDKPIILTFISMV